MVGMTASIAWVSLPISVASAGISLLTYLRGRPKVVVGLQTEITIYPDEPPRVRYKIIAVNDS
jgi:hypothetical protein